MCLLLARQWRALNALLLGEHEAGHLGFEVRRLRRRLVLLAALLVAPLVAAAGAIGFVGLVAPHLVRRVIGADHRRLLPGAALAGALMLMRSRLDRARGRDAGRAARGHTHEPAGRPVLPVARGLAAARAAMLSARDLQLRRNGGALLSGVDLQLRGGEVLGVLGANGAGKSTLLAAWPASCRPRRARSGSTTGPCEAWSARGQARRRAVLPQTPPPALDLPVREVVEMGAYRFPELSPDAVAALSVRALDEADAGRLADRRYPALSGGEQQRVQFARVLAQCLAAPAATSLPACLLLDEPVAGLDPPRQHGILRSARRLGRRDGRRGAGGAARCEPGRAVVRPARAAGGWPLPARPAAARARSAAGAGRGLRHAGPRGRAHRSRRGGCWCGSNRRRTARAGPVAASGPPNCCITNRN